MPVTITWSNSNGGSSIADPLNHGNGANGTTLNAQTIYLSHDGSNPITNAGLYMNATDIGEYGGDFTAAQDRDELLEWGDAGIADDFGGLQINRNATGGFPASSWPDFTNKDSADGHGFTIRTGAGDDPANLIEITTAMGASTNGVIQIGSSPNVRFQSRLVIPTNEGTTGTRHFKLVLSFTSTT